jgi:DNA-binding response OmpR family regulator
MHKILIVEDNWATQVSLTNLINQQGWDTKCLNSADNIVLETKKFLPELILMDIALPDKDGFEACSLIKSDPSLKGIPLIFLTSKEKIKDKLLAFKLGAIDYITKPYHDLELIARIENKLPNGQEERSNISFGDLKINLATHKVNFLDEGKYFDLPLSYLEYKILTYFIKNKDMVLSRNTILNNVWGSNTYVTDRTVDVHISSLRKKCPLLSKYFKSVYGYGYKFSHTS